MKKNEFMALSRAVVFFLTHYKGELTEAEKQELYILHSKARAKTKPAKRE